VVIGMAGNPNSQNQKRHKPPRHQWRAGKSFFDLRFSHWIQGLLALALLVVAGVQASIYFTQAGIMHGQLNAMHDQLDQMALAERPWVMLTDIKPESFSSDDEAGVSFWVKLSVKNVGHSPAQNVSVTGQLLIHDSSQLPEQAMRTVCQEARSSFIIPGRVVFPDQTQTVTGDTARSFAILAEKDLGG
jgi:hypothetical protein